MTISYDDNHYTTGIFIKKNRIKPRRFVGYVLLHINPCRLFNAKSSLYIYIKYIRFGLVGFYGASTIAGYLMPNAVSTNTYILYIVVVFYGISTLEGYLTLNSVYRYILYMFDSILWHINP